MRHRCAAEARTGDVSAPHVRARGRQQTPLPEVQRARQPVPVASRRRGRSGRATHARASRDTTQGAAARTSTRAPDRLALRTGTCSSSRRAGSARGTSRGRRRAPPTTYPSSSGCLSDSRTERGNSGSSSMKRTPRCARETSAGPRARAATDDRRRRRAVMRRAKRRDGDEHAPGGHDPGDRVHARHLERLRSCQRRKDSRQPPGEHRLARARWPHQQQVVRACSGDLERPPRPLLSAQVGEIRGRAVLDRRLVDRLERRRVDPSAEVLDGLVEVSYRHGLDTRERGLRRRLGGAHEPRQACAQRPLGDGERPWDGTNPAVQRELAHGRVLCEPFGWKLPRRPEYRKRDREVEARSLLPQRGRVRG